MRQLLLIAAFTLLSPAMWCQSLIISEKDGNLVELTLANLRKVTFSDGKLLATYLDGTYFQYAMENISKMYFGGTTGVEAVEAMEGKLAYYASSGLVMVADMQGSKLSLFKLSGKIVMQETVSSKLQSMDLSNLQKGLYLLRVAGKTIKISR